MVHAFTSTIRKYCERNTYAYFVCLAWNFHSSEKFKKIFSYITVFLKKGNYEPKAFSHFVDFRQMQFSY